MISQRRTDSSFFDNEQENIYCNVELPLPVNVSPDLAYAKINPTPLLPSKENSFTECMDIFNIQVAGLVRRFEHSCSKTMVIGVSGGLDSTLPKKKNVPKLSFKDAKFTWFHLNSSE